MKIEAGMAGVSSSPPVASASRAAVASMAPSPSPSAPERDPAPEERKVARSELERVVEKLNKASEAFSSELRFSIHERTKQIVVRVIDSSGEVIREIPPEKVLDAFAMMQEALGLLLDEKV
jgi:flagellar protein FlaG